jgi:GntR family transcriptional regulator
MDFSTLDKNSSEQLYMQIRRILLNAIHDQDLAPGQRIPSVSALSDATSVSRMTVRQALQTLTNEGWLYSIPGKGTFVSRSPRIEQNLQHLTGWTEEIASQGLKPSTRLLSVENLPADPRISRYLQISAGDSVVRITRLRLADGFPLSVEKAHLSGSAFPALRLRIQETDSLYRLLRDVYHVISVRALQYLEAGEADTFTAHYLEVPPGAPVLLAERITYTTEDKAVEYTLSATHAGFLRYRTELSAGSAVVQQLIVKTEKLKEGERNS